VAGDPHGESVTRAKIDFGLLARWSEILLPAVHAAGRAILEIRARGFDVMAKADATPVTEADHAAEAIILETLATLAPSLPVVAEERAAAGEIPICDGAFWLVDALDGTKEFVKGSDDFTVNVGFICAHLPVFGIVHAPARPETFAGFIDPDDAGHRDACVIRDGRKHAISVRPRPGRAIVVGSKSHEVPELMDAFLKDHDVAERVSVGSSLKFCLVAEGKADLYPRFGPTSEWDTAAGHAVLRAAGGHVRHYEQGRTGGELRYGKPGFLNGGFLAEGGA
jgi:3'(2'), 5'-bisphosphate nucleotidase